MAYKNGKHSKKQGRFPKLPKETQELVLEAEKAKEEEAEEKLKELKKHLKLEASICGAIQGKNQKNKVCLRKPVSENGRCSFHGGKSTGAKTEEGRRRQLEKLDPRASYVHGAYSKKLKEELTQEEVNFYNWCMEYFLDNFEVDPINLAMLDRFAMNFIKQGRKDSSDFLSDSPSYNDFEVKMIRFAESLGLNNKFKQSKENKDNVSNIGIAGLFMETDE
ncbi:HGGxSTG domain-containing protein [Bacillus sp. AFS040349]|uniref:HGGxSTG domain-containing protein n=1 Tax=Bacillus sp. AFS040349 TaxID=2033502 RepID=UPI000BFBB4C6|nr:HGGxSTG domain-containing protein [Bacillus sp. AFS040349]PGT81573.1 hypothetical protein COD11_17280 [Bacillus sp. AFS040349]